MIEIRNTLEASKQNRIICETPCKRRPMIGRSWWKLLGYNSPCSCAEKAYEEYEAKQKK